MKTVEVDHPLIRQLAAMLAFLDYPPDSLAFWAFVSGQELFGDLSGIDRRELAGWLAGLRRRASLSLAFKARWPDVWQCWWPAVEWCQLPDRGDSGRCSPASLRPPSPGCRWSWGLELPRRWAGGQPAPWLGSGWPW